MAGLTIALGSVMNLNWFSNGALQLIRNLLTYLGQRRSECDSDILWHSLVFAFNASNTESMQLSHSMPYLPDVSVPSVVFITKFCGAVLNMAVTFFSSEKLNTPDWICVSTSSSITPTLMYLVLSSTAICYHLLGLKVCLVSYSTLYSELTIS